MTLEQEQLDDLRWAASVVAGQGDGRDCESAARNMLAALSVDGATDSIRRGALMSLMTQGERIQ